jgi:hypothetical protein
VNCDQVEEYVSALCDGGRIPRAAAEHIGMCERCRSVFHDYSVMASELRRMASLQQAEAPSLRVGETQRATNFEWLEKGFTTMKIPRFAFALMLSAILILSSGLLLVRARAGALEQPVVELQMRVPSRGQISRCVITMDANPKGNNCHYSVGDESGVLYVSARFISKDGDRAQLAFKMRYEIRSQVRSGATNETELIGVPEDREILEPTAKVTLMVSGLGTVDVQGKYLDHIPALVYQPEETIDPLPDEFRVVSPVLIRDNKVLANRAGSSSISRMPDAALMFYVPGHGRYLISVVPFEGAVEGDVQLGQIAFSLEGHHYLLLTSMPSTRAKHVWITHELEFKPSEHTMPDSESRDDRASFFVRSLNDLRGR